MNIKNISPRQARSKLRLAVLGLCTFVIVRPVSAQEAVLSPSDSVAESSDTTTQPADPSSGLRFSFDRTAWRDVFNWIADESELAIHLSQLPEGTFTYADAKTYSVDEAISQLNMFLLPEGFTLVRSQRLLSVLNLRDSKSLQQLETIARVIAPADLDQVSDHDIVKCMFELGDLEPQGVLSELERLQLLMPATLLSASNQIMVTTTAAKQRTIREIIERIRERKATQMSVVQSFTLEFVDLDALMVVARPHLNIEPGQNHNDEINISADDAGKRVYVTGTKEALKLFESLVEVVDVADQAKPADAGEEQLRSHRVPQENLALVFDILQTILAGKNVRISQEPATNSIVALADASTHAIIESTIEEMKGTQPEFAVVPLNRLDPYFAISLLDEMFALGLGTPTAAAQGIKIDAAPRGRELFIRGPKEKVAEIKAVLAQLDSQDAATERVVPVFGSKAENVLERARDSWQGENIIVQSSSDKKIETQIMERVVSEKECKSTEEAVQQANFQQSAPLKDASIPSKPTGDLVSTRGDGTSPADQAIDAKITAQGIVLQSNDRAALSEFESHLRSVADQQDNTTVKTVIYYLKFSTADDATRLLADLIDGTSTILDEATGPQLINGKLPAATAKWLNSYVRTSTSDSTLVSSGTLTVVADSRLNRLICIGTNDDLQLVEEYLKVIDKDESLTSVQTHGMSHIIELKHSNAEEIAEVLRDAFGDRVALSSEQKMAQEARQQEARNRGQNPADKIQTSSNKEPQMHIAVHSASNSLVVTAPDALYAQVETLVSKLDSQAEQAVEVIYYPNTFNIDDLKSALMSDENEGGGRRRRSR